MFSVNFTHFRLIRIVNVSAHRAEQCNLCNMTDQSRTFSFVFFSDQGDYEVYLAFIASYDPSFEDIQQIFIGNERKYIST